MDGLFKSTLTGRTYNFKYFSNDASGVAIATEVKTGEAYRVPIDNIIPTDLERVRLTEPGEQVPVSNA